MIKKSKIFMVIGNLLIFSSVVLFGYNLWSEIAAERTSIRALGQINVSSTQTRSDGQLPDYVLNPNMDMLAKTIDGVSYIGVLQIPALELELPIAEAWNYKTLKKAPCRYSGSAYLEHFVICAHNYSSQFGKLNKLHSNDEIKFTDMDGNVFLYTVVETEVLKSNAVEEMQSSDWDLSLFTCTIGGQSRITVRCIKADTQPEL